MNPEFDTGLYEQFRALLLQRCGLHYPERKQTDLAHGLGQVLQVANIPDFAALYSAALQEGPVWDLIVSHLTIGETYFFRNSAQFAALRQHILPDLLARRLPGASLRIWSAGCATGEEPYSLAMVLADMLPPAELAPIRILATDINPVFLARAAEGVYGAWSFRDTPDAMRQRFFSAEGTRWRLAPEIRRLVHFARLNLAEPSYPAIINGTTALDLIVCRNVTIYFDEETTRRVAEQFYSALTAGGWLIVGHAEPHATTYQRFEIHNFPDTIVYRKPLSAPLFATDPPKAALKPLAPLVPHPTPRAAAPTPASGSPASGSPARLSQRRPEPPAAPPAAPPAPASGSPASASPARLAAARLAADGGDWDAARQECDQILAADPLSIPAHYLLAQIAEHEGDLDAALDSYRRTVYLDRTFVAGLLGMAQIWRQMGRSADAQRCYRNILALLQPLPPGAAVAGLEDATAAEVAALVERQLKALEHA